MGIICGENQGKICDGCGACSEVEIYNCPVCFEECDTLYVNAQGDILGCDNCVSVKFASEVLYEE